MADEMVLETQKWLNSTYGNVDGFGSVPETGITGWDTVYGLTRAAQHEMGITGLVNNWGPGSRANWDSQYRDNIKQGYSHNVVYILQGAFYAKGINPGGFTGTVETETLTAISSMKSSAGIPNPNTVPDSDFMGALLSMKQFSLVAGGDVNVQAMQRELNGAYLDYFIADDDLGYLPADGVFQRETNAALIYALQSEEGLAVGTANGVYGPTTQSLTPTLTPGQNSTFVKIAKWGLYANGFNQSGDFSNSFNVSMSSELSSFIEFMALPSTTNIDLTVFMSLLTSNGNTDRSSIAVDTSTQLSSANIATLKQNGYSIVGRYLSGTVGTGSSERPKNLTASELSEIFEGGMKVFPIFQEGAPISADYFTSAQGKTDANKALVALWNLGFESSTVVYFAVDGDILGADIPGTVVKYFKTVHSIMTSAGYKVGVYGTRNVANQVIDAGYASNAFVSNMSSGYSGNMGFKMPTKWAFDQFVEEEVGGIAIDKDASTSSRSTAVSSVNSNNNDIQMLNAANNILSAWPLTEKIEANSNWKNDKISGEVGPLYLEIEVSESASVDTSKYGKISINGQEVDINDIVDELGSISSSIGLGGIEDIRQQVNNMASKVKDGAMYFGIAPERAGRYGISIITESKYEKSEDQNGTIVTVEADLKVTLNIYFTDQPNNFNINATQFTESQEAMAKIVAGDIAIASALPHMLVTATAYVSAQTLSATVTSGTLNGELAAFGTFFILGMVVLAII